MHIRFSSVMMIPGLGLCGCFGTTYQAPPKLGPEFGPDLRPAVVSASIDLPGVDPERVPKDDFVAIDPFHPEVGAVITRGDRSFLVDPALAKVSSSVALPEKGGRGAFAIPGCDGLFLLHVDKDRQKLSRVDPRDGRVVWTSDAGVSTVFASIMTTLAGLQSVQSVEVRKIRYTAVGLNNGKEILLVGLERPGGRDKPWNRIVRVDAETGRILSDERFPFLRRLPGNRVLLLDPAAGKAQVLDVGTGAKVLDARFEEGDLLYEKNKTPPVDVWDGQKPSSFFWDLYPILAGNQLIVTSRHVIHDSFTGGGDFESKWIRFEFPGGKTANREGQDRKSSADCRIRNIGTSAWPIVLGGLAKEGGLRASPSYSYTLQNLVVIDADGKVETIGLPDVPAKDGGKAELRLYAPMWFQDGETVYVMNAGRLFAMGLKDGRTRLLFESPKDKDDRPLYTVSVHGEPGYALLNGPEKATLVRLSDGKEVSLAEAGELADTETGIVFRHWGQKPDTTMLPDNFQRYDFKALTTMGPFDLVPALLKDGGALLVGRGHADRKVRFWVPVARTGREDEDIRYLYHAMVREGNLVLLVPEDGRTVRVYRIPLIGK